LALIQPEQEVLRLQPEAWARQLRHSERWVLLRARAGQPQRQARAQRRLRLPDAEQVPQQRQYE